MMSIAFSYSFTFIVLFNCRGNISLFLYVISSTFTFLFPSNNVLGFSTFIVIIVPRLSTES